MTRRTYRLGTCVEYFQYVTYAQAPDALQFAASVVSAASLTLLVRYVRQESLKGVFLNRSVLQRHGTKISEEAADALIVKMLSDKEDDWRF